MVFVVQQIGFKLGLKTIFGSAIVLFTISSFPAHARSLNYVNTLLLFAPGFYSVGAPFKQVRNDITHQLSAVNSKVQSEAVLVKLQVATSIDLKELDSVEATDPCASVVGLTEVQRLREYYKADLALLMVNRKLTGTPIQVCDPTLVLVDSTAYGTPALAQFLEHMIKSR